MARDLRSELAQLLQATAEAHHAAFAATDGVDPDWAIWYAGYLQEHLAGQFNIKLTKSELVVCLVQADNEHRARAPEANWPDYYAGLFLEHFSLESQTGDTLALYYFESCPFCRMVLSAIDKLGVNVELRNIHREPAHRDALSAARGRTTVPVLRIMSANGEDRWMPESRDIIRYLESTYG